MLSLIGLGLGNENDLSLRSISMLKTCDHVFLENYTSPYLGDLSKLERLIGKKITLANRMLLETNTNDILEPAKITNVALLIVGDVFAATTHHDLILRARKQNIPTQIIHNTSILTAVGDTGLSLYKFGKTTSIPYLTNGWNVDSPYDALKDNHTRGLHTLFLLDLKPDEQQFMTIREAIAFLLNVAERRKEKLITPETKMIACAALGTENATIAYGTTHQLQKQLITAYPQCLIIPGKLHFIEEEFLNQHTL